MKPKPPNNLQMHPCKPAGCLGVQRFIPIFSTTLTARAEVFAAQGADRRGRCKLNQRRLTELSLADGTLAAPWTASARRLRDNASQGVGKPAKKQSATCGARPTRNALLGASREIRPAATRDSEGTAGFALPRKCAASDKFYRHDPLLGQTAHNFIATALSGHQAGIGAEELTAIQTALDALHSVQAGQRQAQSGTKNTGLHAHFNLLIAKAAFAGQYVEMKGELQASVTVPDELLARPGRAGAMLARVQQPSREPLPPGDQGSPHDSGLFGGSSPTFNLPAMPTRVARDELIDNPKN